MKKGFTLIELLAVILILGIIALIAVPTINNIIGEATKNAFMRTSSSITKSLEDECNINLMEGKNTNIAYSFTDKDNKLELKGKLPTGGGAMITDDECNVSLNINDGKTCAVKSSKSEKIIVGKLVDGMCIADEIETSSCTNNDSNPGSFRGTGTEIDPYLIESIEDLYAIKLMPFANTENKHFNLMVDLDFKNDCSYVNPLDTTFGDINHDGTITGIKEEVTTGKGFTSYIADPENLENTILSQFGGSFNGNNKTISNLYINDEDGSYGGLFGFLFYNDGNIYFKNVSLENANVRIGSIGGILFSSVSGSPDNMVISNVHVTGSITGNGSIGGIIGRSYTDNINIENVSFVGMVNGHGTYLGGIIGYNDSSYGNISNAKVMADMACGYSCGGITGFVNRVQEIKNVYVYGNMKSPEGEEANNHSSVSPRLSGFIDYMENIYNYMNIEGRGYIYGIGNFDSGKNIYNYGNITATDFNANGIKFNDDCYNCYNYGNIVKNGSSSSDDFGIYGGNACTNCANYGDIAGYSVGAIHASTISNSLNYGNMNVTSSSGYFNTFVGSEINNSYSIGNTNTVSGYESGSFSSSLINKAYIVSDITNQLEDPTTAPSIAGLGYPLDNNVKTFNNVAFIGGIQTNGLMTNTNLVELNASSTFNNVYYSKTFGNVTAGAGTSVPFSSITTSWFRDTLNLGDNFEYKEGYYPRVYKLDENGNVTGELVEGQSLVPIR